MLKMQSQQASGAADLLRRPIPRPWGHRWDGCGARCAALWVVTLALAACKFERDPVGHTAPLSAPAASAAAGVGRPGPPVVFNASATARAGDVVSLQGANFGADPRVFLEGKPDAPLEIVNRHDTSWLAVRVPAQAQAPLSLRIDSGNGIGSPVSLDGALPMHLDAVQVVPGGPLRVFGRNLRVPGHEPVLTMNGLPAAVDLARSDEHRLVATAPLALQASRNAVIAVDNGNGSAPGVLDRTIEVKASEGADPFSLGVGWASAFAELAGRGVDAGTDPRLRGRARCRGTGDDGPAIQDAIDLAAAEGGGIVRLPAGRCQLNTSVTLRSRVILEGAGKASTELIYHADYPIAGSRLDLAGLREFTLTSAGAAQEGLLLKDSTRVFIQNVRVRLASSRQMYLSGNRQVVIRGCDFDQGGSISLQGPYTLAGSVGLVFEGNVTRWVDGAPTFVRIHDSVISGNRFTRDARNQRVKGTVHSMALDFAHRVAVVDNTFDVAHGPITNRQRNDGEALLSEGGGNRRTESLGLVSRATRNTLTDPTNPIAVDPFGDGAIPENFGVAIVGGRGAGQTRRVIGYDGQTITVERDWDLTPDSTSRYATFVWGLEKSLIKGNRFIQNPRGIWLYHTAVRDVDVVDNVMADGGGIYLRSYQNLARKQFMPIYNVRIARNKVSNQTGHWMSYIASVFVNSDARPFGIANIGIEIRSNQIVANRPNVTSSTEEYANQEGFMTMMRIESQAENRSETEPRLLGTIISGNTCSNCRHALRLGTGAVGTTIVDAPWSALPGGIDDWATLGSDQKSEATIIR